MERLTKKVEVSSAGTGADLLAVDSHLVALRRDETTDTISNTVYNWMNRRPLLCSGVIEAHRLTFVRREIQVLSPEQREREFMGLAFNEALEFLIESRHDQSSKKTRLEFGDTLFSLLAIEASTLTSYGDMSKESYDSELTKNSFPDLESTFRNLTAEECILYAVGIINQKAGPNDASKLVDLTASLADNDDETFEIVFSQDPVINSINLALDLMARYSILKDWDMVKIIKETTKKNNKNMPEEFFGAFAPFSSVSDTLSCLRLFRKYTFTEEKGIFKKQFSREYFYKMRQLWVIEPLGFQFRLWIAKLIGDIASDQNIPIIDRKLAEKLLERNIETERPLWGQSKHSFELINLDFKHLD